MQIPLRLLGLAVVSLLVSDLVAVVTAPQYANAAAQGSVSAAANDFSCVLRDGQVYCWGARAARAGRVLFRQQRLRTVVGDPDAHGRAGHNTGERFFATPVSLPSAADDLAA